MKSDVKSVPGWSEMTLDEFNQAPSLARAVEFENQRALILFGRRLGYQKTVTMKVYNFVELWLKKEQASASNVKDLSAKESLKKYGPGIFVKRQPTTD